MSELDELRSLFGELREILMSEGGRSMGGRYVEGLCYRLWDNSAAEDLKEIKRDYISLCATRPFSDFYIHRPEREAMVEANRRLDQVRDRLGWLCMEEQSLDAIAQMERNQPAPKKEAASKDGE